MVSDGTCIYNTSSAYFINTTATSDFAIWFLLHRDFFLTATTRPHRDSGLDALDTL